MTSDRYPVGCLSIWDPIHLGIDEAGQPVWIEMIERNLLLGGEPGGGKSNAVNLIVGHAALSTDCRLFLIDAKQVELGPWEDSAERFVANRYDDAIDTLTDLRTCMDTRYDTLRAADRLTRKIARHSDDKVILVAIDELAYFSATTGTKAQREASSRETIAPTRSWSPSEKRACGFLTRRCTLPRSRKTRCRALWGDRIREGRVPSTITLADGTCGGQ